MTRAVPTRAVDLIKSFEECRLTAYHGAADAADIWTVGWGHTGPDVHKGLRISQEQADLLLNEDIRDAAARLAHRVKPEVLETLTAGQYGALVSFVFNLGADPDWTIWKRLNAGQLDDVPRQMMRFVNSNGRKRAGLVRRRGEEVALWSADAPKEPDVAPTTPPSSVTRVTPTPPTPAPAPPLAKTSLTAKVTQLGVGAAGAAAGVQEIVKPHASIPLFAKIAMICTCIMVAVAIWQLWIAHRQHEERKT